MTLLILLSALCMLRGSVADDRERYFSIGHPQFLRTRLDPIVSPGSVSTHVHAVIGASNFRADSDYGDATGSNCTTSFIQADKSNYWAPQLYYKWKNNGTLTAIQGDGLVTYWKYARAFDNETFAVVPDDFRMVAGNISRDYFDENLASHNAISFECVGDGFDYRLPWIPADLECPTIRPQAFFPNCWNGKDSYLSDNSHVAYPIGTNNYEGGPCPDGFVRIPSLFMEAYYHPKDTLGPEYEWYPGCLVLANGDTNGFSYHSDWLNGWPTGMLVNAFNQCNDALDGTVDTCSVFTATKDQDAANACYASGQLVNEAVGLDAPLADLPGNNAIYNSSRASADYPKQSRDGYVESASLVDVPTDHSGTCTGIGSRVCDDYDGSDMASDAEGATRSAQSSSSAATTASFSASSSSTLLSLSTSKTRTGAMLLATSIVSSTTTASSVSSSSAKTECKRKRDAQQL